MPISRTSGCSQISARTSPSEVIATRGDRLILTRTRASFDQQQQGFLAEVLGIVETDLDGRIAATIVLDLEDIEAALEELDARYLAGEAAAHARDWSVMSAPSPRSADTSCPTTPDWVSIDHRRAAAFAPGEMTAYFHELLDDTRRHQCLHRGRASPEQPWSRCHTSADMARRNRASRLNGGRSRIFTFDGDLLSRYEIVRRRRPRRRDRAVRSTQPAGSATGKRGKPSDRAHAGVLHGSGLECLGGKLVDDIYNGDHRRVVNAGIQHGRDAEMENMRLAAELGITHATSSVIAIRGEHLALIRAQFSQDDQKSETFHVEVLS